MLKIVEGDLLTTDRLIIAHQCNCVSRGAKGLAQQLFQRWPWANVYDPKICPRNHRQPGQIFICKQPKKDVKPEFVVALFAQVNPGGPVAYASTGLLIDDRENRLLWFQKCLGHLYGVGGGEVAMPWGIGCGLAGGNWADYEGELIEFAKHIDVYLYRK